MIDIEKIGYFDKHLDISECEQIIYDHIGNIYIFHRYALIISIMLFIIVILLLVLYIKNVKRI